MTTGSAITRLAIKASSRKTLRDEGMMTEQRNEQTEASGRCILYTLMTRRVGDRTTDMHEHHTVQSQHQPQEIFLATERNNAGSAQLFLYCTADTITILFPARKLLYTSDFKPHYGSWQQLFESPLIARSTRLWRFHRSRTWVGLCSFSRNPSHWHDGRWEQDQSCIILARSRLSLSIGIWFTTRGKMLPH